MKHTIAGAAAAVMLSLPVCASAQSAGSATTVQDILSFLVTNQGVQTSDFDRDRTAAEATLSTLTRALLGAIATVPISTSSSGFTYRLNSELGTVERASQTFGPSFVERALTVGAGQASFGFTFQFASFKSLDGHNLENGQFVTIANQFRDEAAPFDIETLMLDITTRTATFYGNIGVSDRIDVGVAVPVVSLAVNGVRDNTYRGRALLQARARAETVGLADIAVRSKVRLTADGPAAVAAGVEVRLPTGREEDLLGAGTTTIRFQGLASAEAGRTSVHGNVTIGTGGLGREVQLRRRRRGGRHAAGHGGRRGVRTPHRGPAAHHRAHDAAPAHRRRRHAPPRPERRGSDLGVRRDRVQMECRGNVAAARERDVPDDRVGADRDIHADDRARLFIHSVGGRR